MLGLTVEALYKPRGEEFVGAGVLCELEFIPLISKMRIVGTHYLFDYERINDYFIDYESTTEQEKLYLSLKYGKVVKYAGPLI